MCRCGEDGPREKAFEMCEERLAMYEQRKDGLKICIAETERKIRNAQGSFIRPCDPPRSDCDWDASEVEICPSSEHREGRRADEGVGKEKEREGKSPECRRDCTRPLVFVGEDLLPALATSHPVLLLLAELGRGELLLLLGPLNLVAHGIEALLLLAVLAR